MVSSTGVSLTTSIAAPAGVQSRHSILIRVTHWITTIAFLALLITGLEILISHPRFHWGETGNVNTPALFQIPIPSSRAWVQTGYGYVMPDQNGWSRYLHFEAGWAVVIVGLLYVGVGLLNGHFRSRLLPNRHEVSLRRLAGIVGQNFRMKRCSDDLTTYNPLFPLVIWTGLDLSPAFAGQFPWAVSMLGGRQSARTIHFCVSVLLTLFLLVHVAMVCRSGLRSACER
jgi:thiosulfate reductase cytochrome b subunit